ncbi:MAG: N-acetylmuramoyl-L-alanine amidase family protein [Thomasclavelia ramosa]
MKRTYLIIIVTVISYICTRLFFFDNTTPVSKELTLKNVSVVIDPGHGGLDNGASVGNIYESDLNLKISFALKEELENRGAKVYDRTDDYDKRNHHYSKQDDMYLRVKKLMSMNVII